ncbi:MAG: hypothetical protein IRZ21_11235 [Thermoleophilaceae bacterium]|nr:hypothetical protein [Thermoleophilaceae bacterium]
MASDGLDGFRLEVLGAEEPEPGRAIVHCRCHGRGRATGLALDAAVWTVYRIRDEKAVSVRDHPTRDDALAHIGS